MILCIASLYSYREEEEKKGLWMQQDLIKESYECGGRGSYATAGHTLRLNDSTRPPPPPPTRIWRHNRSKSESRCLFYFYVYSMCVCVFFFAWCKASSSHTHARRGNRGETSGKRNNFRLLQFRSIGHIERERERVLTVLHQQWPTLECITGLATTTKKGRKKNCIC